MIYGYEIVVGGGGEGEGYRCENFLAGRIVRTGHMV